MKNLFISLITLTLISTYANAQTVIIQNQNNQSNNQQERVIERVVEKPVYIEVERKTTNTGPFLLNGYLRVFPEDLGEFNEYPKTAIANINKNKAYGINTWRIPDEEEVRMLIQNAEKIGLRKVYVRRDLNGSEKNYMYWYKIANGNYVGMFDYYTTYHVTPTQRVIRLVSSGE